MNLAEPSELGAFLARHGLVARKSLGQHFLCSSATVEAIASRLEGVRGILEIGPGPGVLTSVLAPLVERLLALEVDPKMVAALAESAPSAEVVLADARTADLAALLDALPSPRAVVSNLPYYATGPLLEAVTLARAGFDRAVLMMQREVAERVTAPPRSGARGSLSVYLQACFELRVVVQVPSSAFVPPPKVNSTVLELRPHRGDPGSREFFEFVRLGFAQPRKTLLNNLIAGLRLDRASASARLAAAGLGERSRAQELDEDDWRRLYAVC